MLFEWRSYRFAPGKAVAYLEAFRAEGLPLVTRHLPMLGYWLTEVGRLNMLHHLWVYEDLEDRATCRARLAGDADWTGGFGPRAFPMIEEQETFLLATRIASPVLHSAVAGARAAIPAPEPGAPLLAPDFQCFELSEAPRTGADVIASWEVIAGERPGAFVTLATGARPTSGPALRREPMRPCSFSPLR